MRRWVLLLTITIGCVGCGLKGDLYLPQTSSTPVVTTPASSSSSSSSSATSQATP